MSFGFVNALVTFQCALTRKLKKPRMEALSDVPGWNHHLLKKQWPTPPKYWRRPNDAQRYRIISQALDLSPLYSQIEIPWPKHHATQTQYLESALRGTQGQKGPALIDVAPLTPRHVQLQPTVCTQVIPHSGPIESTLLKRSASRFTSTSWCPSKSVWNASRCRQIVSILFLSRLGFLFLTCTDACDHQVEKGLVQA